MPANHGGPLPRTFLCFINQQGQGQRIAAWPHTVFSDIAELGDELAKRYMWQKSATTMFLLTDAIPPYIPMRITSTMHSRTDQESSWPLSMSRDTINIEADIWVSAETINQGVRSVQRKILGRDNRPMRERSCALMQFYADADVSEMNTHDKFMDAWNRQCTNPDWKYDDVWRFSRDIERAHRQLLFPKYGPTPNANKRRQQ